ncbi:probable WRKY transcription factor 70 isoform X2 [Rutidosis leptorrhynchoides]|uniref:probable WRKY transcription factor 70 isoform X2 n=1 Tax=Rutidosis leptorrhynchoides TaxID=125765 RepID=UPI003A99AE8D
MNVNSSDNHHQSKSNCLYHKINNGTQQCKKLLIDLNLPASSNETEDNVSNFDDEALSHYAGTDIRRKSSSNGNVKLKQQVKVSLEIGLEVPPNDGYMWRKYGQKEILNAKYPREYYRCTYRNTDGCCATKQVQRCSKDPSVFEITYLGEHNCPKITKTIDSSSAADLGCGLVNFAATPEPAFKTSRTSDPSSTSQSSSAITRSSFEFFNWSLNHN